MGPCESPQAMSSVKREVRIPYKARRFLSRYTPEVREQILAALRAKLDEKGDAPLTWDDLHAAVNEALAAYRVSDEMLNDPVLMQRAIEDFEHGRTKSSKVFIGELRARVARLRKRDSGESESSAGS